MNVFDGRRVVVTGAASGIGKAIALGFVAAGAEVIGIDLVEVESPNSLVADLGDEQSVVEAFAAPPLAGHIDVLVNAAGIYGELPLRECRLSDFDRLFAVNVRGAILVAREALRRMDRGGRIINLASELAFLGREGARHKRKCHCAGTRGYADAVAGIDVAGGASTRDVQSYGAGRADVGDRPGCSVLGRPRGRLHHRPMYQRRWRRCHALTTRTKQITSE
jgi:NAD(P)-dependent dehydrogenase (short-subunit alcohol dehydrogenase family)